MIKIIHLSFMQQLYDRSNEVHPHGLWVRMLRMNHSIPGSSPAGDLCYSSLSLVSCHVSTVCNKGTKISIFCSQTNTKAELCPCVPLTKHLPVCSFPGNCASLLLYTFIEVHRSICSQPVLLFSRRPRWRIWRLDWTVAWSKAMPTPWQMYGKCG